MGLSSKCHKEHAWTALFSLNGENSGVLKRSSAPSHQSQLTPPTRPNPAATQMARVQLHLPARRPHRDFKCLIIGQSLHKHQSAFVETKALCSGAIFYFSAASLCVSAIVDLFCGLGEGRRQGFHLDPFSKTWACVFLLLLGKISATLQIYMPSPFSESHCADDDDDDVDDHDDYLADVTKKCIFWRTLSKIMSRLGSDFTKQF